MTKKEEIYRLKYTILRRLIEGKSSIALTPSQHYLKVVCSELEGKNIKQLGELHKQYIGY